MEKKILLETIHFYTFMIIMKFNFEYVVLTQNGSTDIGAQGTFVMSEPYLEEIIDDDPEQFILFKSFELLDEENIKLTLLDPVSAGTSDTIMKYL
ncbi:MAG: hypothetical protein R2769_06785 [Saprospiraceae bacterium]